MRTRQHGFSLVEVLIVLSIGGLLMGLAIETLERAKIGSSNTIEQLDAARNLNRLVDQFRNDIHLANEVKVEALKQIVVRLDSGSITYSFADNAVQRVETTADGVTRNERYSLGDRRSVTFTQSNSPNRATLTVQFNTGLQHAPRRTDRMIVAIVGRRQQLLSAPVAEEQGDSR